MLFKSLLKIRWLELRELNSKFYSSTMLFCYQSSAVYSEIGYWFLLCYYFCLGLLYILGDICSLLCFTISLVVRIVLGVFLHCQQWGFAGLFCGHYLYQALLGSSISFLKCNVWCTHEVDRPSPSFLYVVFLHYSLRCWLRYHKFP